MELDREPTGELGQLGVQIRKRRFESYNRQWISETSNDAIAMSAHAGEKDARMGLLLSSHQYSKEVEDEDITWRALSAHRDGNQMNVSLDNVSGYDYGDPGTYSSEDPDHDESWDVTGKQPHNYK